MRSVLKAGFFWQFAGGFLLGAAALVAFHPAGAAFAVADSAMIAR